MIKDTLKALYCFSLNHFLLKKLPIPPARSKENNDTAIARVGSPKNKMNF
jgi:hypothetical protein